MAIGLFGTKVLDLRGVEFVDFEEPGDDLPCPWCRAGTSATDTHCPSCQMRFG
jgi:hypothetical protein